MKDGRIDERMQRRDVPGLEQLLAGGDAGTRLAAARALATVATTAPRRPLISPDEDDDADRAVREGAIRALAGHDPALAVELLRETRRQGDTVRRLLAIEALALIGDDAAARALAEVLGDEREDAITRRAATMALERIGTAVADRALERYHAAARPISMAAGVGEAVGRLAQFLRDPGVDAETRRGALLRLEHTPGAAVSRIIEQYHGPAQAMKAEEGG